MKSVTHLMVRLAITTASFCLAGVFSRDAWATDQAPTARATPRYHTLEVLQAIPPAHIAGGPDEMDLAKPGVRSPMTTVAPRAAASPGTAMGDTYYDYQHNGSTGRQVGEQGGTIQAVWMRQDLPQIAPGRQIYWNKVAVSGSPITVALDNAGTLDILPLGTPYLAGGTDVPPSIQSGYVTLDLLPTGNAVPFFHILPEWIAVVDSLQLGTFWDGSGLFPPVSSPVVNPLLWPKGVVDIVGTDTVLHVVVEDAGTDTYRPIYYYQGQLTTFGLWPATTWSGETMLDLQGSIAHVVVQDPGSDKVAIVYTKPISTLITGWAGQTSNNVAYFESTNGGTSWTGPHMVTNFTIGASGDFTYSDLDAVYDENGVLHIVYSTLKYRNVSPGVFEYRHDMVTLWHWNDQRQTSRPIQTAYWHNTCGIQDPAAVDPTINLGSQAWNLLLAKASISVKPTGAGPGAGIADEVLYASWVQFGPTQTDCSQSGWTNTEIYVSASSDGGSTWDAPRNVTGTETPACFTGGCASEHWVTAAAQADSGVYLSYTEDTDAGGVVQNEGYWSVSEYKVLALAAWQPALEARLVISPVDPPVWQGPYWQNRLVDEFQYPDNQTLNLKVSVSNPGTSDLNFTAEVSDINDGNLYMKVNGVTSYNGSIATAGAPETLLIHIDPTGLTSTSTFFVNITSNAVARVADAQAASMDLEFRVPPGLSGCPILVTGDLDLNGLLQSADVIRMVNYVFKSGAVPEPCEGIGDTNCDGAVQSADIIRMVNYVFKSGAAPCNACTLYPGTWSCL